jgi:tripartite-type tricarboxylate transporter receptor subunit TctC
MRAQIAGNTHMRLNLLTGCVTATAQPYPTHSVTIVVPFPARGATDAVARLIGDRLAGVQLAWRKNPSEARQ